MTDVASRTAPLESTGDYDVVVVGGGPAGCAAGVFTARYGLETAIFDRGPSSIRRCAYLENYLGFPAGIDVGTFYDLIRDHAAVAGCEIVPALVESVERAREGFRVTPQEDDPVTSRFVVAATKYGCEYLGPLGGDDATVGSGGWERADDGGGRFDPGAADRTGRTPVDGLYVAGPLAGAGDQAIVAAGHGATAARALVSDVRRAEGYRGHFAERYDWVRQAGDLTGEWTDRETWIEWFDREAPDEWELPDERIERLRERYVDERLDAYVDAEAVERRTERGYGRLAEHLPDDALLAALDDEVVLEYAASLDADRTAAND